MIEKTHALIQELEGRSGQIAAMQLTQRVADEDLGKHLLTFANRPADLDRVTAAVDSLLSTAALGVSEVEQTIRQLINERHFYGAYCELGGYGWLARQGVQFKAQIALTAQDVLNPNGCTIDGRLDPVGAFFDVKGFGFNAYVMEQFREGLQSFLPGFEVHISGPVDVSVKDIEAYAFPKLSAFRTSLANGGVQTIQELGWTINVELPRNVAMQEHTHNPLRLAEENRYYPFKTAGQFSRSAPFVLFFPFAAQFNGWLSTNFFQSTDETLRALARRVFIQLTAEASPLKKHDAQVPANATVADAAKLLSALLFVDLDNDRGWFYLNPRAAHVLDRYAIEQIFDFQRPSNLLIDDFAYDNY